MNPLILPNGYILKNGVKPIPGFKYNHPLDGHGYVNAFKISPEGIAYKGIRQETYHYRKEFEANKILYRGLGTNANGNPFMINNFNNVAIFAHDNKVYTLGEGGIPYIIDIHTGKTIGSKQIGSIPTFITECLPYLPLSAHPLIYNNDVYNFSCFNYGLSVHKDDHILHTEFFPNGEAYYTHDFKKTANWYIFFLNRVNLSLLDAYFKGRTILESIHFVPGSKVLLLNSRTFESRYIDLGERDGSGTLHIAHAKEDDKDKSIQLYATLKENLNLTNADTPYAFEGCNLHKFKISTDSFELVECRKVLDVSSEMPVEKDGIIYTINKHELIAYDSIQNTWKKLTFKEVTLEEPCISGDTLFLIGHQYATERTHLIVVNRTRMEIVHTHVFDFEVPYGFHGTFLLSP